MQAYVRAKLSETYKDQITEDGLIPAHLLGNYLTYSEVGGGKNLSATSKIKSVGNMWAQSWEHIYPLVVPFPEKASIDVTEQMKQQV